MRLSCLWPGLIGLALHVPAYAMVKELVIGVHPNRPVRAMIAHYDPLVIHLRQELNRPVRIVFARNSRVYGQRLLQGDYELALAPAHMARLMQKDQNGHVLARYENDIPVFLLARKANALATTIDLKNKILAVPDRYLLMTLAGERWLAQHHFLPDIDYTLLVTEGFTGPINAVITRAADMALGVPEDIELTRDDVLRQISVVRQITSIPPLIFVARHDVTQQSRSEFKRALLGYHSTTSEKIVAMAEHDLASMDVFLPKTRLRLQSSVQTGSRQ